ncbi:hypothetical protein LJR296_008106 [Cupriavidus necator]|uniref:hypothetical protein n=1 Tax=Cupriavidus necator TaxID=106590 RepID=UPI003ECDFC02
MALMRRLAVTLTCVSVISACNAQREPMELACGGQVKLGEDVITDKFVLRIEGDTIEIRGEPGTLYTFDGAMYKVCSESRDEVEIEYVAQCGSGTPSRSGRLQKVAGELTLRRYDMGKPFTGTYKCKRASRVLDERLSR